MASAAASGQPLVTLLVPNMNNEPVLELFFERLATHTTYANVELVFADDGSTDGSLAIARRWRDSGRFGRFALLEREHSGIVPTLNAALDEVRGEVIVRLDADATVETPGWLERMLAFHLSDERIGVTVGKVVFDSGRIHCRGVDVVCPEGIHDRGTRPLEPAGKRTVGGDVERPLESEEGPDADEPAEVDAALGCWTMFATDLARELGGWDAAYDPVWFEDIDFSFAARVAGRKVFYLPDVRVIHWIGMRDVRIDQPWLRRALVRANRRVGAFVPQRVKDGVARAASLGERDPAKLALLERHHAHWRSKWGFDPINPDVAAILDRYRGTEVCWRHDDALRRAGEEILARHRPAGDPRA